MTEYRSWNLKPETVDRLEQHREHKNDTQDDIVNNVLDTAESRADDSRPETDTDALQELLGAARTIESRTGKIEQQLEELR